MGIWISGYLPDDSEDEFIKYDQHIEAKFNSSILKILGQNSLEEFSSGMWPLSEDQTFEISKLINQALPSDLDLFISMVRD